MVEEIYLDNNATTRPLAEVCTAVTSAMGESFANPSSAHGGGDRGRKQLWHARQHVAALIGAREEEIYFTSSGTESNNMVLLSMVRALTGHSSRIITTTVEHSSIIKMIEKFADKKIEVVQIPVDREGELEWNRLEDELSGGAALVSVQWVNNETGVRLPVEKIGTLCKSHGVLFHSDACQAVGKMQIDIDSLPIDFLTLTAHKMNGPQGVAALYARDRRLLQPLFKGGPQEGGLRAGTENLPGIVGFGKAAEVRLSKLDEVCGLLSNLRNLFEDKVLAEVPDVTVNGSRANRVCNTTNLCFHGVDGQALVARLDQEGVLCSQSSACTNQRPEPSYVLRAMGLSEAEAYASLRFGFGVFNHEDGIVKVVSCIRDLCSKLRQFESQLKH